jgi:hypothetical protein
MDPKHELMLKTLAEIEEKNKKLEQKPKEKPIKK